MPRERAYSSVHLEEDTPIMLVGLLEDHVALNGLGFLVGCEFV